MRTLSQENPSTSKEEHKIPQAHPKACFSLSSRSGAASWWSKRRPNKEKKKGFVALAALAAKNGVGGDPHLDQ